MGSRNSCVTKFKASLDYINTEIRVENLKYIYIFQGYIYIYPWPLKSFSRLHQQRHNNRRTDEESMSYMHIEFHEGGEKGRWEDLGVGVVELPQI